MSTDVAVSQSAVPDLVRPRGLELGAEDVALARVKIGQFMSSVVQEKLVDAGQIYASTGQDDPEPLIIDEEDAIFYVLDLKKGKSWSPEPGTLQRYDFDDPDAPADAWVTYDYLVSFPKIETLMPFKLMLTRTGLPAARQINSVIAKAAPQPHYSLAFQLRTIQRENKKGKFYVPQVFRVESDDADVKVAESLAIQMSAGSGTNSAPRADAQPDI